VSGIQTWSGAGQAWQPKEGIPKQIEAGQSLGQKKVKRKRWQVSASTPLVGNQRHKGGERLGMKKGKGVASKRVPAAVPQGGGKHFLSTWNTTIKVKGGHEN